MRKDIFYPSCGAGQIHGSCWEPQGEVKAVVQIVHGIAEHVLRYDHFAAFLADNGILVVAEDHMGHGGSIAGGSKKGCFAGGWFAAVEDTYRLLQDTRAAYPNVPYILLGHSMGSFMARTILAKYPDSGIAAAVISGTAWMPGAVISAGQGMAKLICALQDEQKPNKMLQGMMFGGYNKRVEHQRTEYDWLTRDDAIVDAYVADPLCGFITSAGLLRDMLTGLGYIQKESSLSSMEKSLPILFIAGGDDPVGGYGEGVRSAGEAFQKAGMTDVTVKIYPLCRHEVLNEINKEDVYADVLSFIKEKTGI